ncbi:hypothetical protein R1flu_004194 [Riccia fluitans]|uniref:Uncharacterized protein n=1 Tax=Riccia fluitans TaxID=41844 RepID=A0ABD1YPZ1_9MARC
MRTWHQELERNNHQTSTEGTREFGAALARDTMRARVIIHTERTWHLTKVQRDGNFCGSRPTFMWRSQKPRAGIRTSGDDPTWATKWKQKPEGHVRMNTDKDK